MSEHFLLTASSALPGGLPATAAAACLPAPASPWLALTLSAAPAPELPPAVISITLLPNDAKGYSVLLRLANARSAAAAIERLQGCELFGRRLFFCPATAEVEQRMLQFPHQAAAALHALHAAQAAFAAAAAADEDAPSRGRSLQHRGSAAATTVGSGRGSPGGLAACCAYSRSRSRSPAKPSGSSLQPSLAHSSAAAAGAPHVAPSGAAAAVAAPVAPGSAQQAQQGEPPLVPVCVRYPREGRHAWEITGKNIFIGGLPVGASNKPAAWPNLVKYVESTGAKGGCGLVGLHPGTHLSCLWHFITASLTAPTASAAC